MQQWINKAKLVEFKNIWNHFEVKTNLNNEWIFLLILLNEINLYLYRNLFDFPFWYLSNEFEYEFSVKFYKQAMKNNREINIEIFAIL